MIVFQIIPALAGRHAAFTFHPSKFLKTFSAPARHTIFGKCDFPARFRMDYGVADGVPVSRASYPGPASSVFKTRRVFFNSPAYQDSFGFSNAGDPK